jgi:hypothetical protein
MAKKKYNIPCINSTMGKFKLWPEEKHQGVVGKDSNLLTLLIQWPTLYHMHFLTRHSPFHSPSYKPGGNAEVSLKLEFQ